MRHRKSLSTNAQIACIRALAAENSRPTVPGLPSADQLLDQFTGDDEP